MSGVWGTSLQHMSCLGSVRAGLWHPVTCCDFGRWQLASTCGLRGAFWSGCVSALAAAPGLLAVRDQVRLLARWYGRRSCVVCGACVCVWCSVAAVAVLAGGWCMGVRVCAFAACECWKFECVCLCVCVPDFALLCVGGTHVPVCAFLCAFSTPMEPYQAGGLFQGVFVEPITRVCSWVSKHGEKQFGTCWCWWLGGPPPSPLAHPLHRPSLPASLHLCPASPVLCCLALACSPLFQVFLPYSQL